MRNRFFRTFPFTYSRSLVVTCLLVGSTLLGIIALSEVPFSIIFLVLVILLISFYIPSKYSLQRVSISAVLVIGLSPFYLLARGFVTESKLGKIDLYVWLFIIFNIFVFLRKKTDMLQVRKENFDLVQIISGLAGLLFGLVVQIYLLGKSTGFGVAWVSSGDSKNHLITAASLVDYGDLLPSTFLTQPINLPSTLSLLFAQIGTDLSTNPETLISQMKVYSYFWVLLIGFTGTAFAAAGQVIQGYLNRKISKGTLIAISFIPFLSIFLGPALNDGFFTAVFGVTALTVMTTWFLEIQLSNKPRRILLLLGVLIFLATLMSWMFIVAVTFPILIFGLRSYLKAEIGRKSRIDFFIFASVIIGALSLLYSPYGRSFIQHVKEILTANGAVTSTSPNFYYSLILVCALLALVSDIKKNFGQTLYVIALVHFIAIFAFKLVTDVGIFSWNYYLLKYQWITMLSIFGILVTYFILQLENMLVNNKKQRNLAVIFFVLVVTLISETVTPATTNKTILKILRGWENPRSSTMDFALNQNLDYKNPTMFFRYGYAGDARLANFWMNAYADPQDPIRGWNYTIDTIGDPKQLCDVNAYYPKVTVITSDMMLERDLKRICPNEDFEVKLVPPAI